MLRILLVEDEQVKRQLLIAAICAEHPELLDNISVIDNVRDAKREISKYRFDLVVLDLNIPKTSMGRAELGAGLDILSYITNNRRAIAPGYIFGLTAYDEAFTSAADAFESAVWKLARFSHTDSGWKRALSSAIAYLIARQSPPYITDGKTYHCDVGIAVALDEELRGVLELPCGWRRLNVPFDYAQYYGGNAKLKDKTVSIVATVAPRMGMTNMAIAASKLVSAFHPRILASTGLCAGVRGKTDVGDILVADPCFDWGSGKWVRQSRVELKFHPAPYQWRLDAKLAHAARETGGDYAVMSKIYAAFEGEKPVKPPRVLVDAMASGASVLQVEQMMKDVREQHKNLIGIEMENYAVFAAAENASEPRPMCITVKSVCDFGDENKNDAHRAYAAHTSTQFLWNLIQHDSVLEPG